MNIDRWQQIVEIVKSSFDVEESGITNSEERGGTDIEFIIFNGPLGRLKLEFATHPALMNTKTKYTKRIGADIVIENVYSPTDTVSNLVVWKWDDDSDDWKAFDASLFQ